MPATGSASHRNLLDLTFTGRCDLSLERAVVPYVGVEDRRLPGGRSSDLGVGVVLKGPESGTAEVVDLGSGAIRHALLDPPLVLFGWIFAAPFRHLRAEASTGTGAFRLDPAGEEARGAIPGLQGATSQVLGQLGYSPLTRPLFLRIGFRDVALDLDPHEGTAVRLALPGAGVARVFLEYDRGVLVVRTGRAAPPGLLQNALSDAFPGTPLYQLLNPAGPGTSELHVQLGGLETLGGLRGAMRGVRRGLLHLLARFDPARYQSVVGAVEGFGERDLLGIVGSAAGEASPGFHLHERALLSQHGPAAGRIH